MRSTVTKQRSPVIPIRFLSAKTLNKIPVFFFFNKGSSKKLVVVVRGWGIDRISKLFHLEILRHIC